MFFPFNFLIPVGIKWHFDNSEPATDVDDRFGSFCKWATSYEACGPIRLCHVGLWGQKYLFFFFWWMPKISFFFLREGSNLSTLKLECSSSTIKFSNKIKVNKYIIFDEISREKKESFFTPNTKKRNFFFLINIKKKKEEKFVIQVVKL